jgi:hypothetical protein
LADGVTAEEGLDFGGGVFGAQFGGAGGGVFGFALAGGFAEDAFEEHGFGFLDDGGGEFGELVDGFGWGFFSGGGFCGFCDEQWADGEGLAVDGALGDLAAVGLGLIFDQRERKAGVCYQR